MITATGYAAAARLVAYFFWVPLRDLRISVTDRCNFRCVYCMPKEVFGKDYQFLERKELLTFEEIARLARIFTRHGVEKIRLTGGEPLVRRNLETPDRNAGRDSRPRPDADHQRLAAREKSAARSRPPASNASRSASIRSTTRRVHEHERRRFSGRESARRHRRRRRGRPRADQDQHGGQARRQRREHPADGAPLSRQRPYPALHRIHGRRPHQRLAHGRRGHRARDRRA